MNVLPLGNLNKNIKMSVKCNGFFRPIDTTEGYLKVQFTLNKKSIRIANTTRSCAIIEIFSGVFWRIRKKWVPERLINII